MTPSDAAPDAPTAAAPPAALPLYRVDLKYCGAPFEGWQSQPGGTGVQDHLEKALATILRHPVRVTGAARTDSGVHAEAQTATFRTALPFAPLKWMKSLQGLLPEAIGIMAITAAPATFHPILSSRGKAYCYRIWQGPTRNPMVAPYCWRVHAPLDIDAMRAAARALVGTHDYTSFCATDSGAKTRERTVVEVSVLALGPLLEIWVVGHGFLKQMVRTIAGTLVDVGAGRLASGAVAGILAARDRRAAGMTAPASGLSLVRIIWEPPFPTVATLKADAARQFVLGID